MVQSHQNEVDNELKKLNNFLDLQSIRVNLESS